MLQRAPTAADASITVVIEYVGAAALCRQLRALVQQQQDAKAADIWVAALRDPDGDGGDEARRIVASFKSAFGADAALSVVSSATLASADGASDASGARSLGRLARFQLGLQATTQYVLLLDGGLVPPPNLLHTLSRVSQLPEAHGILGVAGWRSILEASADSTAAAAGGTAEPSVMELNAAVGGASLSMPSSVHEEPRIDRLMAVDALRGCWFGKTSWLPLLFREAPPPSLGRSTAAAGDPLGEEAWISAMFARHGDLPSLLLPGLFDGNGGGGLAPTIPDDPTAAKEAAWRRQLWEGVRRGDPPPSWRSAAAHHTPSSHAKRTMLLVVASLEAARALAPLLVTLSSSGSLYEPRLVLAPEVTHNGGCAAVATAMGREALPLSACRRANAVYELRGNREWQARDDEGGAVVTNVEGGGRHAAFYAAASAAETAAACASMMVELENVLLASEPVVLLLPEAVHGARDPICGGSGGNGGDGESASSMALQEAVRAAASADGSVVLLEPPIDEVHLLEWLAVLPPSAALRWHEPTIEIAVITHKRPTSLRRLLRSMSCAHYAGDPVDVSFTLEAGADDETVNLARSWKWRHGRVRSFRRAAKGGLIAAVVESWVPSGSHSYGILLEDDIEVSPHFYLYAKLMLLRHVYANGADGGGGGTPPSNLLGISLYTPRLVELTMPRKNIDLYGLLGPGSRLGSASSGHTYLQQLPCSWGQLFFPQAWLDFRAYMLRRLHEHAEPVNIPNSACCQGTRWGNGGWGSSWKKFFIELLYLKGHVILYPNFYNQTSFSTNHLEVGEHVGGKSNKLKHRPIDFTVPLLTDFKMLRQLWIAGGGSGDGTLAPLAPLKSLPTLDLFSESTTQEALVSKGAAAVSSNPKLEAALGVSRRRGFFG